MKTCIFGGTFDPPHIGHLLIAQTIIESENFERLISENHGISTNDIIFLQILHIFYPKNRSLCVFLTKSFYNRQSILKRHSNSMPTTYLFSK